MSWQVYTFATIMVWSGWLTPIFRRRGWIICRDQVLIDVITWSVGAGIFYLNSGFSFWANLFWPGIFVLNIFGSRIRWKVHRTHDEDCKYGPRKKKQRQSVRNKLKKFAPAKPLYSPS